MTTNQPLAPALYLKWTDLLSFLSVFQRS